MKRIHTLLITFLSVYALSITGCASTSNSLAKLEQTTPQTFTIPINYVDAYANAKAYYQQCVARAGVSYPITVYTNGTPVTITNRTPDTVISSNLDRSKKSASLGVYLGSNIDQRALFAEASEDTTIVTFFSKKIGLLRSDAAKQKQQDEQIALLKQVSSDRTVRCIR